MPRSFRGILMFFAKRKPEEVSVDGLGRFLNLQFEKRLGSFGSRAQAITDSLDQTMLKFEGACDRFVKLDAEPYTQGRRAASVGAIKAQKSLYAESLKRILSRTSLKSDDAANSYERYQRIMSNLDAMIKEILETNASFKMVLYCYSNHLWDFKNLFADIERFSEALKGEIGSRSKEFSEYSDVSEHISRLNSCREELKTLNKSIEALKTGTFSDNKIASDTDGADTAKELGRKREELARLDKESSELHDRINSLVLPLERASKKLDYLSASKTKLHAFVEDPIHAINNESEYNRFRELVQELNDKIRTGAIDLKNSDRVREAASKLLDSDIHSMIRSLMALHQKGSDIAGEIDVLERNLSSIKKEKTASERQAHEITDIEGRAREIEKSKQAEKTAIEKLVQDRYGVMISITGL